MIWRREARYLGEDELRMLHVWTDKGAKFDRVSYREPVEITDERRSLGVLRLLINKACISILNLLKMEEVSFLLIKIRS